MSCGPKPSTCCPKPDQGSCCPPSKATTATNGNASFTPANTDSEIKSAVKQYYGEELQSTADLKTSACKICIAPPMEIRMLLKEVPEEVSSKFYGCGTPLPLGVTGLRLLDLGCGSGRDCYVAARLVGEEGAVTGVDMTPSQLNVATRNLEAYSRDVCRFSTPNMKFVHGEIEYLDKAGIPDSSQDIVISNCVINLSPDKPRVLREVYRVLASGGEMYFSDVYCDRRLQPEVRSHPIMIGECLGGALYLNDFIRICHQVGFTDPRCLSIEPITVDDPELKKVAGEARFFSITFRLFKISGGLLEDLPHESYGQTATYLGTLPGNPEQYTLDSSTGLKTGVAAPVDGNTATLLSNSWLAKHFTVTGDRSKHRGAFPKSPIELPKSSCTPKRCGPSSCC